ncbi:MAG: hypothetical protein ACI4JS_06980 [Oscillospiraceae bacterium]
MDERFGCDRVNELMENILSTLQEYEKQTDTMINADLEVLQQGLIARNELIGTLDELKDDLDAVIEVEQPDEARLLRALINGSAVTVPLDDAHKKLQLLQKNVTILKQRILDKDKVISGQFKDKHVDSRRELEALKQTKQKIGYYNSAMVGRQTGQSLNKNR